MTTSELIAELASLMGKVGSVTDTEFLRELKLAQTQLERGPVLPHFLIDERQALTEIGEPRVAVPARFLRETEGGALGLQVDGQFIELEKNDVDDLRASYNESESGGQPKYYGLVGGNFWLFPVPDQVYTLRMHYYRGDDELAVGDSGNLWSTNYPDLLIGFAGRRACMHWRALDIKPIFDEILIQAREQMTINEAAREMANMERSFG